MEEGKLKEAFSRIKEDILSLGKEISEIKEELIEITQFMKQLNKEIIQLKLQKATLPQFSTHIKKTSTHPVTSTQTSTHLQEIEGWKNPNLGISIGNEGVSTDRQTDRQTNRHTSFDPEIPPLVTTEQEKIIQKQENVVTNEKSTLKQDIPSEIPIHKQISEASEILDSLDSIKKDIRRKFKKITKQEMLVFSTIYTLEEQDPEGADYKKTALKLGLSQSSIRDYVQRIVDKGIPIIKEKLNNKKIILHISPELKKIATLNTIIKLREI